MQVDNNKTIVPEWVKVLAFAWAFLGGLMVKDVAQAWAVYISGVGASAVVLALAYRPERKEVRNE